MLIKNLFNNLKKYNYLFLIFNIMQYFTFHSICRSNW